MNMNDALITIPLFPLGATLFPDGVMHLKIFEVRYLDMIKNCVRDQTPFGVVTIDQGNEVRMPEEKVIFSTVGTFANISHFEAVQPNLFVIECIGGARFTTHTNELKKNGLWVAEVRPMEVDPSIAIPLELQPAAQTLQRVIDSMRAQGIAKEQMPFTFPHLVNDCGWVANRWCELLPLTAGQREHLLGLANPRLRLDLVFDLLEEIGIATNLD